MISAALNATGITTAIVVGGIVFGVVATLTRAAWILSKATVSQLEATRLNTQAIKALSGRLDRIENNLHRTI